MLLDRLHSRAQINRLHTRRYESPGFYMTEMCVFVNLTLPATKSYTASNFLLLLFSSLSFCSGAAVVRRLRELTASPNLLCRRQTAETEERLANGSLVSAVVSVRLELSQTGSLLAPPTQTEHLGLSQRAS